MKNLCLLLVFFSFIKMNAQQWQPIIEILPASLNIDDLYGRNVAIDGNIILVSSPNHDFNVSGTGFLSEAGAVYVFERDAGGNWTERQKLVASDRLTNNRFGSASLAISGNYAVISPSIHNYDQNGQNFLSNSGAVYVFERDSNGNFNEVQILVASDRKTNANFGKSVDIEGDTIFVGASGERGDANNDNDMNGAGAVYVYKRDVNGVWNEIQKIVSSTRALGDHFGTSIALDGNTAIIGSDSDKEDAQEQNPLTRAGSAMVFLKNSNGLWIQSQKLTPNDRAIDDYFGSEIAMDGEFAVFGVNFQDQNILNDSFLEDSGAVYIFKKDVNGFWTQLQKIIASDRVMNDQFGWSVDISGNRLIVGAKYEDNDSMINPNFNYGAVYAYKLATDGTWGGEQIIRDPISNGNEFGFSVALFQDRFVVGSRKDNGVIFNAGSAHVFEIDENLGIIENTLNNINIFPNPTKDKISIDFKNVRNNVQIIVTNSLGQLIQESYFGTVKKIDLDLKGASGLYFVTITSNVESQSFKIIKD